MSFQDPIADCLTRIRNGLMRGKDSVFIPYSKLKHDLINVLVAEGYLKASNKTDDSKPMIKVELKYHNEFPVIKELKRISKPSLRKYSGASDIDSVKGGLGSFIISTNQGLMTDKEAKAKNVGGEILCEVFLMSRVAKNPINVPDNVELNIVDNIVKVKGSKGELEFNLPSSVSIENKENVLTVKYNEDDQQSVALAGTTRSIVNNMIIGVSEGFEKKLELIGVGYRAKASGKLLELTLGFSHPIKYQIPEEVEVETPSQTEVVLKSHDKQILGQAASEIRAFRPPEPYKGKGVRYADEQVKRKEAKKAAAGAA